MGSQQSRPEESLLGTAEGHGVPQAVRTDILSQAYAPGPFIPSTVTTMTPVTSVSDARPSDHFPTDLPERPPKPSRLSLRKKKSVIPTPSLQNTTLGVSSLPSPPLSPQSSGSTIFTQATSAYDPFQQVSRTTPPPSPVAPRRLSRFSRKPFRLDSTSHLLKPAASTPALTATLDQSNPHWTRQHHPPPTASRLSLSPPSGTPELSRAGEVHDPLAERFARLRLGHFSSTTSLDAPSDSFTQTLHQNPWVVLPDSPAVDMGATRHASRPAAREISGPYQVKPESQPRKRVGRPRKRPERRVPSPIADDDDVFYPDLSEYVARVSSESPLFEPEHSPSTAGRAVSADQEEIDRKLALQLQDEEDSIFFDINTQSRHRTKVNNRGRSRSPSPSDDDLYADWNPWAVARKNDVRLRRKPVCAKICGTRQDPINLDSDDENMHETDSAFARQLQDEEVANRMNQEETDAEFALRLQREEEEERQRQLTVNAMRDCAVCGDSFPIRDLPALVNCTHEPQTCATCFQTWIETELNSKSWNTISCPWSECRNILQHYEVQQYATQEVYDRFDKLSARSALNDDPNFYNCMARNCDSGQFHYRDEHGTIFRCVECDFHFCIVHKNTWHEGETCEEYDYRISGRKEADQRRQEEASEKAIKKLAKKCPGKNCNYHIEKNEGCDHMTCQRCRHEFCWECLAPYKAIRARSNAAHNPGCKYHSDNIR